MHFAQDHDTVDTGSAFSLHARAWIASFFNEIGAALEPDVQLRYYQGDDFPDPRPERQPPCCLFGRGDNDLLVFHVCENRLSDVPLPALRAMLEIELAVFTLGRSWDAFNFNFQKEILSSVSVSGTALQLIRKIVWHLETALKLQAATRMLLDLGRGQPQVVYYFYVLNRSTGDGRDYKRMQQHDWVRGLFLCQKSEAYLSIFLLQQAGLSPELVSFWEQCHPFLLASDRRFLDRLARQTSKDDALPFAALVVRMFALVRSHLSI